MCCPRSAPLRDIKRTDLVAVWLTGQCAQVSQAFTNLGITPNLTIANANCFSAAEFAQPPWSGPRNLSTAMMRSFGSRADTFVSDEPFYGCFLKATGADHPMRDEVIAAMDCDWASVMATLRGGPDGSPIWYQKQMWHHMAGPVGYDDFAGFTHAFLIREPERMIASYLRKREAAEFEDFGLERQAEFFDREADRLGHAPPVIDANDVLADPAGALSIVRRPRHPVGRGDA